MLSVAGQNKKPLSITVPWWNLRVTYWSRSQCRRVSSKSMDPKCHLHVPVCTLLLALVIITWLHLKVAVIHVSSAAITIEREQIRKCLSIFVFQVCSACESFIRHSSLFSRFAVCFSLHPQGSNLNTRRLLKLPNLNVVVSVHTHLQKLNAF